MGYNFTLSIHRLPKKYVAFFTQSNMRTVKALFESFCSLWDNIQAETLCWRQ